MQARFLTEWAGKYISGCVHERDGRLRKKEEEGENEVVFAPKNSGIRIKKIDANIAPLFFDLISWR